MFRALRVNEATNGRARGGHTLILHTYCAPFSGGAVRCSVALAWHHFTLHLGVGSRGPVPWVRAQPRVYMRHKQKLHFQVRRDMSGRQTNGVDRTSGRLTSVTEAVPQPQECSHSRAHKGVTLFLCLAPLLCVWESPCVHALVDCPLSERPLTACIVTAAHINVRRSHGRT